jgi:hypothetical protein
VNVVENNFHGHFESSKDLSFEFDSRTKILLSSSRMKKLLEMIIKHFVTLKNVFINDTFVDDSFADDRLDFEGERVKRFYYKAGRKKKPAGHLHFGEKVGHVRLYPVWSPYFIPELDCISHV